MNIKNIAKGFTIIELLVVVAIIAVLAAIVLVNVTGYINQGKNAAIKGNMSTILTNAAVYYDATGHYGNFSSDAKYTAPLAAATAAYGTGATSVFGCNKAACATSDAPTAWCACTTIKTTSSETGAFCVDSTGFKGVKSACTSSQCSTGTAITDGVCKGT